MKNCPSTDPGLMFPKPSRSRRRRRHPKSILHEKNGTCYLCILLHGDRRYHSILHEHHIFGGSNRKISEEYGLKVYLCVEHHETGPEAVHNNAGIMRLLRQEGQSAFEEEHSREEFVRLIGKNYLEEDE